MHFIALTVPAWLSYSALAISLLVAILAALLAPWRLLLCVPARQHLLFGSVVVLLMTWSLSIPIADTFSLHFLLVTSAVLLLGLSFGLQTAMLALLLQWAVFGGKASLLGLDALCAVIVPASMPVLALRLARRLPGTGIFAFTLGAAFVGGAFSVLAATLATLSIFWLSGQRELLSAAWEQIGLLPLLMFGEGFINGTLMTGLAVFHPDLVRLLTEPE